VKVGLERLAAGVEQFRKGRHLKTTTISSSAIPTCVFSFVKGEKRSYGSLICFLLGKVHSVHSAKQAAWEQSGRSVFCHWFGPFVCESGFGRKCFRESKRLGSLLRTRVLVQGFLVVTNVHEKETLRGGDLIVE
jgi:hypothetical protein